MLIFGQYFKQNQNNILWHVHVHVFHIMNNYEKS